MDQRNFLLICFCFFSQICACYSQKVLINWQKSYGGNKEDYLGDLYVLNDGSLLIAGESSSGISGNKTSAGYGSSDGWLIKTDANGNVQWQKVYGGNAQDGFSSIVPTSDGNFLLAGYSESLPGGNKTSANYGSADFWIIKVDKNGNKMWENTFGGNRNDAVYSVVQALDKGFVLFGYTESGISGNKKSSKVENMTQNAQNLWIVKVDENGNYQWEKDFGSGTLDYPGQIILTRDSDYVLCSGSLFGKAQLIKLDKYGNTLWKRTYGGVVEDNFNSIAEDPKGNLIAFGVSATLDNKYYAKNHYWIAKLDNEGNMIWDKRYLDNAPYYMNKSELLLKPNGNIMIFFNASTALFPRTQLYGSSDLWLWEADSSGNPLWEQMFGGDQAEYFSILKPIIAGNYIIGGYSLSGINGNKTTRQYGSGDIWVLNVCRPLELDNKTRDQICIGTHLDAYLDACDNFYSSNIFTVQLSDSTGSFDHPINIGQKISTIADSIQCTIPGNLRTGNHYHVRVLSSAPPDTSDNRAITLNGEITPFLGNDTAVCEGSELILKDKQLRGNYTALWSDGSFNDSLTVNGPGIYWLEIKNACGTNRDSIHITTKPGPILNIGKDAAICKKSEITLTAETSISKNKYLWSTGDTTRIIHISNPGQYSLTVTDSKGCSTSDTIQVRLAPAPMLSISPDTSICPGKSVRLWIQGGNNYNWSPSAPLNNSWISDPTATPQTSTTFYVTIYDSLTCGPYEDSTKVNVTNEVNAFAGNDTTVIMNQPFQLHASGGNSYLWNPPTGLSNPYIKDPEAIINHDMTYYLKTTDNLGCIGNDTINIKVFDHLGIYVPNAFSPNGDGKNDIFKPVYIGIRNLEYFMIYNRWGKLIFRTNNEGRGWDGTLSEIQQPTGSYIWILKAIKINGEAITLKGSVTLIR